MASRPAPKSPLCPTVAPFICHCHGAAPFEMAVRRMPATSPLVYRRPFRRIGA